MSAEQTETPETVAVRMVFPIAGMHARPGQVVSVPADQAATLVASQAAVFAEPLPEVEVEVVEEVGGGKSGKGTRQARPRGNVPGLDAGGGTAGVPDGPRDAEPGEGNLAG